MTITKEQCIEFALKRKEETGLFPKQKEWISGNGFPCGVGTLTKLFKSYNIFRKYCQEPILKRNDNPITLEWMKEQCLIDKNDCWNWKNCKDQNGYGIVYYNKQNYYTHRAAYKLKYPEEDISNLIIRHLCHNRLCCNPDHVKSGSRRDNSIDSRDYSKSYKLTKENVIDIRKDMKNYDFSVKGTISLFDKSWAEKLRVSDSTISNVRRNLKHKEILINE